jgi:uncharacterized protein YbjT (DUF2867 family)
MQGHQKIAVAGATGRVGRHVVDVLEERGHEAVAISRATGVDVITGDGLAAALVGVDTIIDVATGPSPEQQAATEFFTTATRNLQTAGAEAGVQRVVVVSIIGIDHLAGGYSIAKLAHEQAMRSGPIPVQILRASQFHEFVELLVQWGTKDNTSYVPKMRTQLIAARSVAEALVDLATGPAPETSGATSQIAGPREESVVDVAQLLVSRRGIPLKIEGVTNADDPDAEQNETGGLLPGPDATLAGPTFEEWLDASS